MSATQRMLDLTANNLANVSTNAFKKDGLVFKDALEKSLSIKGREIGEMSFGVTTAGQFTDFSQGTLTQTGNPLDLAINGEKGAFKVQLPNGNVRYTRDGAFKLNAEGQITTREGYLVLDESDRPIEVGTGSINIDPEGKVFSDEREVGKIGVFDGAFTKEGSNLYTSTDATGSAIGVVPKAIEGSNVNAVEAMVQLITVQRSFELSQKAVTQHDELTGRLIQSLNDR